MKTKPYILFYIANSLEDIKKSSLIKKKIQSCYKNSTVSEIGYVYTVMTTIPSDKEKLKEVLLELGYDNILRVEFWINGQCVASPVDSLEELLENIPDILKQFKNDK